MDVSLRDGGFLNNWEFSAEQIQQLVAVLDEVGVECIELGYLSDAPRGGLAARCPVDLLYTLREQLTSAHLVGMTRCHEPNLFKVLESRKALLDMIRIVVSHPTEMPLAIQIGKKVKQLGMLCSLNLANFSTYLQDELLDMVRLAATEKDAFDVFYFADSRGAATPDEIFQAVQAASKIWKGKWGFHAHDNLGLATANTQAAIAAGCTIIDGSVKGYGLGAGNTELRHALSMIQHVKQDRRYKLNALQPLYDSLRLPTQPEQAYLQYLAGRKNLSTMWIAPILQRYGNESISFLQQLPRKRYQKIEDVFTHHLLSTSEH